MDKKRAPRVPKAQARRAFLNGQAEAQRGEARLSLWGDFRPSGACKKQENRNRRQPGDAGGRRPAASTAATALAMRRGA